jgi:predicted porin
MKKVLLGTSALLGVGLLAGTAQASDGVKLSLGGFMKSFYGFTFDDDGNGDAGHDKNLDGVGTDGEVYFLGSVTLDNGITVGTRIELEAESTDKKGDKAGDQIDAAYVYFKGGFGDIRIGSQGAVADNMYMLPPSSTANFGVFSPAQIGSALVISGFDPSPVSKPQSIAYYSPTWSGFSFGLSYVPEGSFETQGDGVADTFHPDRNDGDLNHELEAGVHYDFEGDGWGLALGGAVAYSGDIEEHGGDSFTAFNTGVNLSFGGLSVGTAFTYKDVDRGLDTDDSENADEWSVGVGLAYNVDAWTVGAGWALRHQEDADDAADNDDAMDIQRVGVTGSYAMGPGIDLDAGLFYSWESGANSDNDLNNYDSLEFSVGSSITF